MKELYLVRHAKSSWTSAAATDFDRPLNSRGHKSAPFMAGLLRQRFIQPDLFISSPANRALTTARYFISAWEGQPEDVQQDNRLYPGSAASILAVVRDIPDRYDRVMLFGHNPGMTAVVNQLGQEQIPNLPTAGVAGFTLSGDHWCDVLQLERKLIVLEFPKTYKQEWI